MRVKTYVAPSKIEGLGLFAAEDIKKGTETWRYLPPADSRLSPAEVAKLDVLSQEFIKRYSGLSISTGKYIIYGDDTRFCNHSKEPNVAVANVKHEDEFSSFALRDIKKGEELTIDYQTIDQNDAKNTNPELYTKK